MPFLGMLGLAAALNQQATPTLWLDLKGNVLVNGQPFQPRLTNGATRVRTPLGMGYNFTGQRGAVLFGDLPALSLSQSITISTWIYPRHAIVSGPGAQILFRGDDRGGYDPYSLRFEDDGALAFQIQNEKNDGWKIRTEIPLNRWSHVVASLDARTGDMAMWLNGIQVGYTKTSRRMFATLDKNLLPGVSVGNVQSDQSCDNEPFDGLIADLRIYSTPLTPPEVDFGAIRPDQGGPAVQVLSNSQVNH